MIKKYVLVFVAFLCFVFVGFGQATLPLTRTSWDSTPVGWTDTPVDSYTSTFACSTNNGAKFDTTSDRKIVNFDSTPDQLTFVTKSNNATTTSSLLVEQSADGTNYTTVVNLSGTTNLPSTCSTKGPYNLNSASRFIRWTFTKGSSNMTMDDVSITEVVSTSDPNLTITGTPTNHGSACPSTSATTRTYIITNSGTLTANGVTVTSSDPQFVVSNLSSTSITAGATATYDVTFTPTSAGAKSSTLTVASTTTGSNSPTSSLTGTGLAVVNQNIATNTANPIAPTTATLRAASSTFGICPATTSKGFVYALSSVNNTPTNGGIGVTTTSVALGSQGAFTQPISGLAEGTTYSYQAYLFNGTTYVYGGVRTFTTDFNLNLNTVTNTKACLTDNGGTISWTPPATGATPTGYMVFAVLGATTPGGTATTALTDYNYADSNYASATNTAVPASLGKLLYRGTGTSVDITGLTENTVYSFMVLSYQDGGSVRRFSNGAAGARALDVTAQDDVKTFTGTPSNSQVTLNWTYNGNIALTSCFDEVIIVANEGPVGFTPSGDGSLYSANSVYTTPNQVVYKGTANTVAVTNLTNETEYCFTIFIRRGTEWSDGTEICIIPDVVYCNVPDWNLIDSEISDVQLVGEEGTFINNPTVGCTDSVQDYTAQSADLYLGGSYPITVTFDDCNGGSFFDGAGGVWIDWNRDGDFADANEAIGTVALELADTDESYTHTFTINVPAAVALGKYRMRVMQDEGATILNINPCVAPGWGSIEDYSIYVLQPTAAEINIKGANISIPNGFDDPYGLNNTLFAGTDLGDETVPKEYIIHNLGLNALNLTGNPLVEITGNNPNDFIVTQQPANSVSGGGSATTNFFIKFAPIASGERTAIVSIANNDGNENPYTFMIQGTGLCTSTPVVNAYPDSGPVNTVVTFTSSINDLTGASVSYNGVAIPIISASGTTVEAAVPTGAANGNMVLQLANGCTFIHPFDLIDFALEDCDGGGTGFGSQLTIYELYDENGGSGGFVSIYNGTNADVNLSGYNIQRAPTYGGSYSTYSNLSGNLPAGNLAIISVSGSDCPYTTTGNGSFGIAGFNGNDGFRLRNGTTIIDDVRTPNYVGFYMKRKTEYVLTPNTTYDLNEWIIQPVNNSGSSECLPGFGEPPIRKVPPIINELTSIETSCDSFTLNVVADQGTSGGAGLTYQWYSNAPGQSGWTPLTNGTLYSGATSQTLTISNSFDLDGYQYYVRVLEGGLECYAASDATKLTLNTKRWNGSISNNWNTDANWSPLGVPTDENVVVIPSATTNSPILAGTAPLPPTGSPPVYAKTLIVLNGATLEVHIRQNLIVENCIANYGTIDLKDTANLVQVNEDNQNSGNGDFFMERIVSDVESLNYIYWSSPIAGFNLSGIPGSNTHRYYWSPTAINANGTQGDWLTASGVMNEGVGYIIRASGSAANLNVTLGGTGLGTPHNGTFTTPISKGNFNYADPADDVNNYWNLVGNPYPSAIWADAFILENAAELMDDDPDPSVTGTIYLWRHQAIPNSTIANPFYEDFSINYDGSNYVAYNATGSNPNGEFNGSIASGQAFFVIMDENTINNTITFTNSMRYGDALTDAYNNTDFLRSAQNSQNVNTNIIERHRLWLDLIAPNNTAVSTLVGYVSGATNGKDRLFDGYNTNATGLGFYSMVGYDRMGIQGRALPFDENDIVLLGVNLPQPGTYTVAINHLDGLFEAGQTVYLEDTYTNVFHDLRATPYTFQSAVGTFDDRFILRYTNSTLSIPDVNVDTNLTIIELPNGQVKFSVGNALDIKAVDIIDMLGRTLYQLDGNSPSEIYDLSNLSQAAYIAKVRLSNGQVITKRAVKRH